MVDIHTHLLVGIDDGSQELSDSLDTLRMFDLQGYTSVMCTPHINSRYNNSEIVIRKAYRILKDALAVEKINVSLLYGAEYSSNALYEKLCAQSPLVFLNQEKDKDRDYVMFELPMGIQTTWYDNLFRKLSDNNVGIVLAHPERHVNFKPFEKIWSAYDTVLAINMLSFLGEEGKAVRSNAFYLLSRYGENVVICSDAHPALKRNPKCDELVRQLQKKYPPVVINYWLKDLPQSIILGTATASAQRKLISTYLK